VGVTLSTDSLGETMVRSCLLTPLPRLLHPCYAEDSATAPIHMLARSPPGAGWPDVRCRPSPMSVWAPKGFTPSAYAGAGQAPQGDQQRTP
jgi:hypothetical protein